jgi:uncharacterized membrane protein
MTLARCSTPAIRIHETALVTALAFGLVQLTASKGTIPNRLVGWSWALWCAGDFTLLPGRIMHAVVFGS